MSALQINVPSFAFYHILHPQQMEPNSTKGGLYQWESREEKSTLLQTHSHLWFEYWNTNQILKPLLNMP